MRGWRHAVFSAWVATLAGCGGGSNVPKCVPGDSKSCTGPGSCAGYQICSSQGSYGTCVCNPGGSGGTGGGVAGSGGSSGSGGTSGGGGPAGASGSGGAGGASGGGGSAGRGGAGGVPSSCTGSAGQDGGVAGGSGGADAGVDGLASDGPSSDPQFLAFCSAVRAAMVSRNMRCFQYTRDQAESVVNIDPCAVWGADLNQGFMSFDATSASTCAADLQTQSCAVGTPPASCTGVLVGHVVDYVSIGTPGLGNGYCNYGTQLTLVGDTVPAQSVLFTQCLPGSFCIVHPLYPNDPEGICRPLHQSGETCTGDLTPFTNRCVAGSTCDHTGHCAAPASVGAACVADSDCSSGAYCRSDSTCQPVHATGACSIASECLPPGTCRSGTCTVQAPGSCCVPMPTALMTLDGQSTCNRGEYCGMDGVCHAAPVRGQPCYYNPGCVNCPESYECMTGYCLGTATAMSCMDLGVGGSCFGNLNCGPNLACVPSGSSSSRNCQPAF
jgi:hypothetical protein